MSEDGTITKIEYDPKGWPRLELRDDENDVAAAVQATTGGELHAYISRQHAYSVADIEALGWMFTELAKRMKEKGVDWI